MKQHFAFRPRVCAAALLCALVMLANTERVLASEKPFRPPAVPLVTSDPYLSIWSEADRLTDDATRHWTRREHSLVSLIRVDGKLCRLMGKNPPRRPPCRKTACRCCRPAASTISTTARFMAR